MEQLIAEVREAKACLLSGAYEMCFEKLQNIDDELVTMEIKKERASATTHNKLS